MNGKNDMSYSPDLTHLVFGSRFAKPNLRRVLSFAPNLVGGLTPGKKAAVQRKISGNEDSMGYIRRQGSLELMLLADSHFGSMAGDFAVTHFLEYFERAEGNICFRLFAAHMRLDEAVRREKLRNTELHPACATTLLSVCIHEGRIHYCSTGDSRLFLIRGLRLLDLNEIQDHLFVGDTFYHLAQIYRTLEQFGCLDTTLEPAKAIRVIFELTRIHQQLGSGRFDAQSVGVILEGVSELCGSHFPIKPDELSVPWHPLNLMIAKTLPVWGSLFPRPGDGLFLASDGIEEEVSGLSREAVGTIVCDMRLTLEKRAEKLLKKSLGKNGGHDNLMFLIRQEQRNA